MKKIINDPNQVVSEMCQGMEKAYPHIKYVPDVEVLTKKDKEANKVGLVSGGGSGHEPSHAGYVGKGMLDSAVCGNVFASPSPDRIIEGIKEASTGAGVLLIIKNYSGDIMNFEMAAELAEMEDIQVEHVVVRDDVAVEDSTYSTGRRGIAGTVFIHKIAGAKAVLGGTLGEVKEVAEKAIGNLRSMGMAMSSCTIPAVGKPGFELAENEIEIGMGIHGEPGVERTNVLTAEETARVLCEKIFADKSYDGKEVAVMVNGLGSTPQMELLILFNEVEKLLAKRNITIYKSFVGNYMTALEMAGCSVSLLELDDELKTLIDTPCQTPAMNV